MEILADHLPWTTGLAQLSVNQNWLLWFSPLPIWFAVVQDAETGDYRLQKWPQVFTLPSMSILSSATLKFSVLGGGFKCFHPWHLGCLLLVLSQDMTVGQLWVYALRSPSVGTGEMAHRSKSCTVLVDPEFSSPSSPWDVYNCFIVSRLLLKSLQPPCEQAQACLMSDERLHEMRSWDRLNWLKPSWSSQPAAFPSAD